MSGTVRKNSGLTTPQHISDELRVFLKLEKGRNLSRIEVTRAINSYINIKHDEKRPNILEWSYLNPKPPKFTKRKGQTDYFPRRTVGKTFSAITNTKKMSRCQKITEAHKNKITGLKETKIVTSDNLHYRTVQKLIQVHYL